MKLMTPREQKKFVANTAYGREIKEECSKNAIIMEILPIDVHSHKNKVSETYCIFSPVAVPTPFGFCVPIIKHDKINLSLN